MNLLLFSQQNVCTGKNITPEEIFSTKETTATNVHAWMMARSSVPKNIVSQVTLVIKSNTNRQMLASRSRGEFNRKSQGGHSRITLIITIWLHEEGKKNSWNIWYEGLCEGVKKAYGLISFLYRLLYSKSLFRFRSKT